MVNLKYFSVILTISIGLVASYDDYPECDENKLQWFPHQLDCTKYYLCHHGYVNQRSCAPKLHFNNNLGQCMIPPLANCQLKCPPRDEANITIFLPDYNDCSKFFICYNGEAIHRSCADGLHFDTKNNWCNFKELVECDYRGDGSYIETTTTDIPAPPEDDIFETTEEEVDEVTGPTVTATTYNPDRFLDCPLAAGPFYYAHSLQCHKYFKCLLGIAFLLECPYGLEYDQYLKTCRTDADCYARNPTTSTTAEPTTIRTR